MYMYYTTYRAIQLTAMDSHRFLSLPRLTPLHLVLLLSCCAKVCTGQGVTVTVAAGEGFLGLTHELTCRYTWIPPCPVSDNGTVCTVDGVMWEKGSERIGYLDLASNDTQYFMKYNKNTHIIERTSLEREFHLEIQSVSLMDNGSYTCTVYTRVPGSQIDTGTGELKVSVQPTVKSTFKPSNPTTPVPESTGADSSNPSPTHAGIGGVVGAVIGCLLILAILIVVFVIVHKRKKKPTKKNPQPEKGPSDVSYAEVSKTSKKTPSPSHKGPSDVPYAVVINKTDESYSPSSDSDFVYDNAGEFEKPGRVGNEDGLVYTEVIHDKSQAAPSPIVQGEKPTEYASVDITRLK